MALNEIELKIIENTVGKMCQRRSPEHHIYKTFSGYASKLRITDWKRVMTAVNGSPYIVREQIT